ncbi:UDP-N-acetylmuramoyl-L-alanyl-D-glutamate--2,6-diaminopimelate ligase [Halopseudomonas aestusnigri]|uniref:UDP-N-acetylmuramoyl-L-alanyl-D-glutamate--2,6-diaminopimelate ligase n=1 Tax=Halopseudomonas aestusnigri TaxID=857252 RepID=A0AAQ1JPX3_9GAMM|nr:UDP-N-acetylmuramoyl-L-alanyl-D-glutamate--2,6-diaminopimelate ligase [Halopseudomonas aestusnigri]OWL89859.1 UDP-N-acetylmuramoyl-L-alanyl-D-glutamate--2,6-diaminopimelate ligase [Halopseudomonas aestusnigri]SEG18732.1 UDP-N-acetylmuramoylalanyl-D-glutamate--2,6-diaminopimelate ligase [Halopseudomonas aestusnigri]
MKLSQLFPGKVSADADIHGITLDSRHVRDGDLFVAFPGLRHDGRDYIAQAVAAGAAAVVLESQGAVAHQLAVPSVQIEGLAEQLSALADRFYQQPSAALQVIGITGTNGKTSVSQMLAQALDRLGNRCGVIGTLGSGLAGALIDHGMTTPDAVAVQAQLASMRDQGASHVAMEVSSHALDQHRVAAVRFAVAVFTNLSRDHLDYHGTMAAYGEAKARLFQRDLQAAVVNLDDAFGRELAERCAAPVIGYSLSDPAATLYCRELVCDSLGLNARLQVQGREFALRSPLLGSFNMSNLLAVLGGLLALGVDAGAAVEQVAQLQPPAGRMQRLGGGDLPLVVVDYAHTPDALEKALTALHQHAAGRVVCIFGCGGDRDNGKRPMMARVAEQFAEAVVVTDDNPRTEPSQQIIEQICRGAEHPQALTVIPNRAQAIASTIAAAQPGDVILLAGKGHENYQEIDGVRHPFSDIEQASLALQQWEAAHA